MRAGVLGPQGISRALWRRLSPRQRVAIEREHQKKKGQRNRRISILPVLLLLLLLVPFCAGIFGIEEMEQAARAALENQNQAHTAIRPEMLPEVSRRTGIPTCAPDNPPDCVPALESYASAASAYQMDWTILAAIGKRECNHGRGACQRGMVNECGARGPMQFLGNTWRAGTDPVRSGCPGSSAFTGNPIGPPVPDGQENQGYATDANGDGTADPWVFPDATHSAARMLVHNRVKENRAGALRKYNESDEYVNGVLADAEKYRGDVAGLDLSTSGPVSGNCHVLGSTERYTESQITPALQRLLDAVVPCFGRAHWLGCFRTGGGGDHPRGRACDFAPGPLNQMPNQAQLDHGHQLAQWLIDNADTYGVRYVIWQQRIWHVEEEPSCRFTVEPLCRRMENRGNLRENHYDHVHVSIE